MINKLINFIQPTQSTIYDTESLTTLESIGKCIEKINECIIKFNNLEVKNEENLNEFQNKINNYQLQTEKLLKKYRDEIYKKTNDLNEVIKAVYGLEDAVNYVTEQSKYVQELAKQNADKIAKGDIVSQSEFIPVNNSSTNWINVTKYGIDNTGETDITTTLQKIIDEHEGYVIYFPKGDYQISQIKLPFGVTIKGDGIYSTTFIGNSETDMFILKDKNSAYVHIEDCFIDGNNVATRGVFAYKEEYTLLYLDNSFYMNNVYVKKCTIANIQLGKDNTAAIMECKITNVKAEQSKGIGLYVNTKCTDSYFEGIYTNSNEGGGYKIEGYNLKFVNCKSCWDGTISNKNSGFYLTHGGLITLVNCETQDNYGHGIECYNITNLNINIIADRNGNGGFDDDGNQIAPNTPEKYGVYLNKVNFANVNVLATNGLYSHTNKYTQKSAVGFRNSSNININIECSHHPYFVINEDENSHNIDINVNGTKWQDITPSFNIDDSEINGVTIKQINNESIYVNGTATEKIKIDLKGSFGNINPLFNLQSGNLLKVKNTNENADIFLMVVTNRTSVLCNINKEKYIPIEDNIEISEIAIQINKGSSVNTIITPKLNIIPIGSN